MSRAVNSLLKKFSKSKKGKSPLPKPGSGATVIVDRGRDIFAGFDDPLPRTSVDKSSHFGTLVIAVGDPDNKSIVLLAPSQRNDLFFPQVTAQTYDTEAMLHQTVREVEDVLGLKLANVEQVKHEAVGTEGGSSTHFLVEDVQGVIPVGSKVSLRGKKDLTVLLCPLEPGLFARIAVYHRRYLKEALAVMARERIFFDRYGGMIR
ncbi:MAG: hypothetical protein V4664_03260 [Patescibacteria group bacterium]